MYKFIFGVLSLLGSIPVASQTLSTKNKKAIDLYVEADNYRVRGQYDQAIRLLKQAIEKDKKFEEAYYRLGITYLNAEDLKLSSESFEQALALTTYSLKQKTYLYLLAENYLRGGQYEKSIIALEKYQAIEKIDKVKIELSMLWKEQASYGLAHQHDNLDYQIRALNDSVNKYPMQYFPAITADESELFFTERLGYNNDNEDIVVSKRVNGEWGSPNSISKKINSPRFNEGTCSVSADGRYMIFVVGSNNGKTDLFESRKIGNDWTAPTNLGPNINSNVWDSQPSLSADGRELYFVSARRGGLGGRDIWYSRKDSIGRWKKAINLGAPINTKFDEVSPFIHANNHNLYFASNGMPGFGGYDIYVSEKIDEQWQTPKNMGAPLNDFEEQYSFVVTSDGLNAYYSREEGRTKSKIYQTNIPKEFQVHSRGNLVKGIVTDSKTKLALRAQVELFDLKTNQKISVFNSDSVNGQYLIVIPGQSEYALHVSEPGYLFYSLHFNYEEKDQDQPLAIDIALQPIVKNAMTVLNNIFFDFNQSGIKPRSFSELDEVVKFLNENPKIKVEISGHTDNVGDENYNQQLSLKRAQSVVYYFILKGIAVARLTQIGYGSKKPIKSNDSEENRRVNRRIEFKIVE